MANFNIPENPEYSEEIRKFETSDPVHADLMNAVVEKLVMNEAFLKAYAERLEEEMPFVGTCVTVHGAAEKAVHCPGFVPYDGARIMITFANGNSSNYMTLNVNQTGGVTVWFPIGQKRSYNDERISKMITGGCAYEFVYQAGETPKWIYAGMANVPIEYEKPEFTEAAVRANIAGGEKISVILGKIKKYFSDMKGVSFSGSYDDLTDKPTAEDVGAVKKTGDTMTGDLTVPGINGLRFLSCGAGWDIESVLAYAQDWGHRVIFCADWNSPLSPDMSSMFGYGQLDFLMCVSGTGKVYTTYPDADGTHKWVQVGMNKEEIESKFVAKTNVEEVCAKKSIYGDTAVSLGRKAGTRVGNNSFAVGQNVEASGDYSAVFGYNNIASYAAGDECSFAVSLGGWYNKSIYSETATLGGSYNTASDLGAAAIGGQHNTADAAFAVTLGGINNSASNHASCVIGKYGRATAKGGSDNNQVGDVFVVGNGTGSGVTSNALRVTYAGDIYGTKAFQSSGADYAEFLKPWADGNPDNEDRIGYFVTIKNGLLQKADEGDFIAGITSGNPSIVGNADEDYYWRYERDKFNRIVMEDVPELVQKTNEEGRLVYDVKTHKPIMEETGKIIKNARMKLAENYNPELQKNYVERKYRKEWDYVGMLGVLPVRDDGTCMAGQFCRCKSNGIATLAERQDINTYFVIERIDKDIVSVIMK